VIVPIRIDRRATRRGGKNIVSRACHASVESACRPTRAVVFRAARHSWHLTPPHSSGRLEGRRRHGGVGRSVPSRTTRQSVVIRTPTFAPSPNMSRSRPTTCAGRETFRSKSSHEGDEYEYDAWLGFAHPLPFPNHVLRRCSCNVGLVVWPHGETDDRKLAPVVRLVGANGTGCAKRSRRDRTRGAGRAFVRSPATQHNVA
jgi:hypothetical protein